MDNCCELFWISSVHPCQDVKARCYNTLFSIPIARLFCSRRIIYLLHGYQSPFSLFTGMIDENVCFPPSMEPDNTTQTNSTDPRGAMRPCCHLRGWEKLSKVNMAKPQKSQRNHRVLVFAVVKFLLTHFHLVSRLRPLSHPFRV